MIILNRNKKMEYVEIIKSYWNDLIVRIHIFNNSTKKVKYIINKCFNSEHPLNKIKIENYKILKIMVDAFNTYSNISVDNLYLTPANTSFKQYPIPHQNALCESDKEYLYMYIHNSMELLNELYNQKIFLKPYTDIGKLQYYCKKIIKRMNRLLEMIEYVPSIPDKLNNN